jgi:hypothetical protein
MQPLNAVSEFERNAAARSGTNANLAKERAQKAFRYHFPRLTWFLDLGQLCTLSCLAAQTYALQAAVAAELSVSPFSKNPLSAGRKGISPRIANFGALAFDPLACHTGYNCWRSWLHRY